MSNTAKISDRIPALMQELGIKSDSDLEKAGRPKGQELLSNGQISKWWDQSVEWSSKKLEEFLNHYKVNRHWWRTGEGPIRIAGLAENPTHDDIEAAVSENPLRVDKVYKDLVEGNSEYSLIPKTVLAGEYRLVLDRDIAWRNFMVQSIIEGKNETISQLKDRIEKAEKRIDELTSTNGNGSRKAGPKGVRSG